jgi:hypothetical protein
VNSREGDEYNMAYAILDKIPQNLKVAMINLSIAS